MDFFNERINPIMYSCPGIYSIACEITDNIFFGESEDVYNSLFEILCKLRSGTFEDEVLQEDFYVYGESCFEFLPYDTSPELVDPQLRKELLKSLNEM